MLHDDGAAGFSARSGVAGSVGNRRADLRDETRFEIHASKPTSLSEFQRQVRACADFLSIACLALCESDELVLSLPTSEDDSRAERGILHAVPVYRGKDGRSSTIHMLFRFSDIAERAPELFRSWKAQRLASVSIDLDHVVADATDLSRTHTAKFFARSLDWLHVAAAHVIKCTTFVSADDRQLAVARTTGLKTTDIKRRTRRP